MTITPHREGHLLLIPETLSGGNFTKLSAFPGYHKWQDRNLIVRATGANLEHILGHWPEAEWLGGTAEVRESFAESQRKAEETRALKAPENALPDASGYRYAREPMEHQRKGFLLSRDTKAFALLMEQGTGKTKVVIDNACYLYQREAVDALVIVAWPNGVHRNWIEYELPADMTVPYFAEYWSSNHATQHRRVAWRKVMLRPRTAGLKVFSFNIEAFTSEAAKDMLLEILENFRCFFVIDQSASIKNPQAKRTKFLVDKCSQLAPYRRVLDGAPVAEGADELYSQFKFLDPWIIGHDTWTGFKAEYCEIGYWKEIKGYKNMDRLRAKIDGHCYRVLADDCLDLPPRVYKRWAFDLSASERRIFDELKQLDIASFSGKAMEDREEDEDEDLLTVELALVKNMRLQQIASGWWPTEQGVAKCINGDDKPSRLSALQSLLDAAPGKALIFSRFRRDLHEIQQLLGEQAVSYHGGVGEDDRALAKRRFMNDPKVLYFIGQPRSAGIGHTLTAARHVIFYANDDSLRLREECEKRAHRQGLKETLTIWDMVASGSHDRKIIAALREKKELSNAILSDPANFFLQHED